VIVPLILTRAGSFPDWGDVATWATALVAALALGAAVIAYRKQAESVRQQGTLLDLQRRQLADQQQANSDQAKVVEAQLREMAQRAEAYERQQADAVTLAQYRYEKGLRGFKEPDLKWHAAEVSNQSRRPIRNVACRLQIASSGELHPASLVGHPDTELLVAMEAILIDYQAEDARLPVMPGDERAVFIFTHDTGRRSKARFTARFTDDAGLHWQIDHDQHLEKLLTRDW
jgi:hypothetical protein